MNLILQMEFPSNPKNKYWKRSATQGHRRVRLPVWFDDWIWPGGLGCSFSPNAFSIMAVRTGALWLWCCCVVVVFTTKEQSFLGTLAVFLAADAKWAMIGFEELLGCPRCCGQEGRPCTVSGKLVCSLSLLRIRSAAQVHRASINHQ